MSYSPVERLRNGNVDFLYDFLPYDRQTLQERIRGLTDRLTIVQAFYEKAKDISPSFCFEIIYDMDEYSGETLQLMEKYTWLEFTGEKINNLLNNTLWGENYVYENIEKFLVKDEKIFSLIFDFIFSNAKRYNDWIIYFSKHMNLHYRFLFIQYVIEKQPNEFHNICGDDLSKVVTNHTGLENEQLTLLPEKMSSEDLSKITHDLYESNLDKSFYIELKEFLLNNYTENDLAEYLLRYKQKFVDEGGTSYRLVKDEEGIAEFKTDADRLYTTSRNYQFHVMKDFSNLLSKKLVDEFEYYNKFFPKSKRKGEFFPPISKMYSNGLFKEVKRCVDTYFDLSKDKTYEYINSGSTSDCYRIGDYIFKLIRVKWSYEDIICPNLYLIIKNFEEIYLRDKYNHVSCGLEVQKFLKKSPRELPDIQDHVIWLEKALESCGYVYYDRFLSREWGDNIGLLDSYKDADYKNPEELPKVFKKTPIVIIDRDRIFRTDNNRPKILRESYD